MFLAQRAEERVWRRLKHGCFEKHVMFLCLARVLFVPLVLVLSSELAVVGGCIIL